MNTYSMLQDRSWGIRTDTKVEVGQVVLVTRKDGSSSNQTIKAVLGELPGGSWLCSVEPTAKPAATPAAPAARRSNWRPCGYPGCNPRHCDECEGEGARGRSYY